VVEAGLVEDRDAERLRLRHLGLARALADDDRGRLPAHRPRRLATTRRDGLLGALAAVALERAGHDDGDADEHLRLGDLLHPTEVDAAARSFSTTARLRSFEKKLLTLRAMIGPMPSTAAIVASSASRMPSRWPKARARTWEPAPPRWGMLSPTSRLASGRSLDASIPASSLAAETAPKPSRVCRSSAVSR
jgi:hypothetical protein